MRGPDDRPSLALAELLRAVSHPVRLRVLDAAGEGDKISATKLRASSVPDVEVGTLSYHVRCLAEAGLLRSAGQVQKRGAFERLYVISPRGVMLRPLLDELEKVLHAAR